MERAQELPMLSDIKREFDDRGFHVFERLLDPNLVAHAARAAEALFRAPREHPVAKFVSYGPGGSLGSMCRVDHPQLLSADIAALIREPSLARAAAELMGGRTVQAWYCHLLRKPPRGHDGVSHVGWHQDGQYTPFFSGRFVTAWVPLTRIEASDSLCYIERSHRIGIVKGSGFSHPEPPGQLKARLLRHATFEWNESRVRMEPGSVSLHDSLIVHGSYDNRSDRARLSLTIHMRSDLNRVRSAWPNAEDLRRLHDPAIAPVIRGAAEDLDEGRFAWAAVL